MTHPRPVGQGVWGAPSWAQRRHPGAGERPKHPGMSANAGAFRRALLSSTRPPSA